MQHLTQTHSLLQICTYIPIHIPINRTLADKLSYADKQFSRIEGGEEGVGESDEEVKAGGVQRGEENEVRE